MNVSEVQVAPGEAQLLEVRTFPLAEVAKVFDVPVAAVDQAQPVAGQVVVKAEGEP